MPDGITVDVLVPPRGVPLVDTIASTRGDVGPAGPPGPPGPIYVTVYLGQPNALCWIDPEINAT